LWFRFVEEFRSLNKIEVLGPPIFMRSFRGKHNYVGI
jgi:hypothetical protein